MWNVVSSKIADAAAKGEERDFQVIAVHMIAAMHCQSPRNVAFTPSCCRKDQANMMAGS